MTLTSPPQRIVSLIPSSTEVLYALGAGDKVVAVTSADDYPPEVKKKPNIGSVLTPSIETILVQHPDLVVAIGSLNQKPIAALERAGVSLLVVDPQNIEETYNSILLLGKATGRDAQAEQIVREMKARIDRVRAAVQKTTARPRVLIMYGTDPIYTTGPDSFINDVINIAGGKNIVERPLPGNVISAEKVVLAQPEVIITRKESAEKARHIPGWAEAVPAVIHKRFFLEGSTLVRPTPRLVEGVEALAHYLHPEWKEKE